MLKALYKQLQIRRRHPTTHSNSKHHVCAIWEFYCKIFFAINYRLLIHLLSLSSEFVEALLIEFLILVCQSCIRTCDWQLEIGAYFNCSKELKPASPRSLEIGEWTLDAFASITSFEKKFILTNPVVYWPALVNFRNG